MTLSSNNATFAFNITVFPLASSFVTQSYYFIMYMHTANNDEL